MRLMRSLRILIHWLKYRERPEWSQYKHYNSVVDYNRAESRAISCALAGINPVTEKPYQRKQAYAEAPYHLRGQEVFMQIRQAEGEEPVAYYYDPNTKELVGEGKVKGDF
jgi:hypothetical protein